MIDSVFTRVLCHRVGIFDLKQEAAMHQFLDSVVRHKNMGPEVAVDYCVQRWKEYEVAAPDLNWTYGSAYRFFMSGMWDKSGMWPWRQKQDYGPDPNVGVYRPNIIQ